MISEQSFDHAVDVDFTWSAKAPRPGDESRTRVIVPPMITPMLQEMSKHLKAVAPEPGFEVIGKVERLSNQEASDGFDLALRANIQGRERLLALELSDDAREVASTAWKTGRSVFSRGTLDRRFRPYRLLQPDRFRVCRPRVKACDARGTVVARTRRQHVAFARTANPRKNLYTTTLPSTSRHSSGSSPSDSIPVGATTCRPERVEGPRVCAAFFYCDRARCLQNVVLTLIAQHAVRDHNAHALAGLEPGIGSDTQKMSAAPGSRCPSLGARL